MHHCKTSSIKRNRATEARASSRIMRSTRVILCLLTLGGCNVYSDDPTDISGDYAGNAIYTMASGVDAGSAMIELASTNDGVDVAIGAACSLSATSIETLTVLDYHNTSRFVLSTDS